MEWVVSAVLLLLLLGSVGARVSKCCWNGESLVLNSTGPDIFECATVHNLTHQLFDPLQDEPAGVPACNDGGQLGHSRLDDYSCAELLLHPTSQTAEPVLLRCDSAKLVVRREPPETLKVRKCCPTGSLYDLQLGYCVDGIGDEPLFNGSEPLLLDVYTGPPTCEHVLVDHKVDLDDVYYGPRAISVTIRRKGSARNMTINGDNACLEASSKAGFFAARLCHPPDYCEDNPCIRKCCPENEINYKCREDLGGVAALPNFRASLASVAAAANASSPLFDITNYGLIIGKPTCKYVYSADANENWTIGTLGEILVPGYPPFDNKKACIEYTTGDPDLEDGLNPFYCFDDDEYYYNPSASVLKHEIRVILAIISCSFLLATLLVYICLPSLQNLHGKTLMCYVVSLLFALVCLASNSIITFRLLDNIDDYIADLTCKFVAYAMIFCFHSAFLWLNVMCFDIWWTLGGMQGSGMSAAAKRRQQRVRFAAYCCYAWGTALALTLLAFGSEHLGLCSSSYIGRERCWFPYRSNAELFFFIMPVTATLLVNTLFFVVTSRRCGKVKAEIKRVTAADKDPKARKFHSDKTRLILDVKLFVVMGIPWLLENIPAQLQHYFELADWIRPVLRVADVVNSLQGLWIFMLFVLKPKVFKALVQKVSTKSSTSKSSNTLNLPAAQKVIRTSPSLSTINSNFPPTSTATY